MAELEPAAGDALIADAATQTDVSEANDPMEATKDRAVAFAEGLAQSTGKDITVAVGDEEPDSIVIAFEGADSPMLVGRGGQGLDALQYLASLIINRRGSPRLRVTFDADDFRLRREATLKQLARDLSEQVLATGQEAVFDPMSPMERRIVHNAVSEVPGVQTYSEGEEPNRYIVIAPAS